ncbi:MAG: hypothetical protein GEU26_01060 [Nitrososphaeraceae archaeon]|nr:hypothetical protein [Nitrososphaeraceae archaeon]
MNIIIVDHFDPNRDFGCSRVTVIHDFLLRDIEMDRLPKRHMEGNVMAYTRNYRICLRRYAGDRIVAAIVKSPYHLENKTYLMLSEKRIEDI